MKERLDVLLVSKGFFESREKAKRAIMAGLVFIGQERYDKAGTMVPEDADIHVKGDTCPYVSRGGLKLEKSIKTWDLDLNGAVCMDIGSSTGGFTDCMLQNGAAKVYALDNLNPGPHKFRRFLEDLKRGGYVDGARKIDLSEQFARARTLLGI